MHATLPIAIKTSSINRVLNNNYCCVITVRECICQKYAVSLSSARNEKNRLIQFYINLQRSIWPGRKLNVSAANICIYRYQRGANIFVELISRSIAGQNIDTCITFRNITEIWGAGGTHCKHIYIYIKKKRLIFLFSSAIKVAAHNFCRLEERPFRWADLSSDRHLVKVVNWLRFTQTHRYRPVAHSPLETGGWKSCVPTQFTPSPGGFYSCVPNPCD